jgi:hypothetical protein
MERNLNQDADSYASALAAYNSGLGSLRNQQAEAEKEAEQKDSPIDTALELVGGEIVRKPLERLADKALGKVGDAAREALNRGTSRVAQAIQDHIPVRGISNDTLRAGVNGLRSRLGMNPLSGGGADPAPIPSADEPTSINLASEPASQNDDLISRVVSGEMSPEEAVQRAATRRALYQVRQGGIGARSAGQPATPEDQAARLQSRAAQLGDDPAPTSAEGDEAPEEAEEAEEGGDAILPAVVSEEAPAVAADAAAAAEGGLNPIADLIALALGVGTAVAGATHHSAPMNVDFKPINPSIQHGI